MNNEMLAKAMIITFRGFGIEIDALEDYRGGIKFLFTVPSSSEHKDAHGLEMSGKHLASVVKNKLEEMGFVFTDIRYHIRNEHWTEAKRRSAEAQAKFDVL